MGSSVWVILRHCRAWSTRVECLNLTRPSTHTVEPHSVKLPYPVSDIMATYVGGGATGSDDDSGFIIITGGCDSVKGNERSSWDENLFVCMSTSNRTLRFDPFSDKVTEVAPAPHARQRHAAVVVDGIEVWVVGGRDTDDNLVTAIDVSRKSLTNR